jgi:hypothetical protein
MLIIVVDNGYRTGKLGTENRFALETYQRSKNNGVGISEKTKEGKKTVVVNRHCIDAKNIAECLLEMRLIVHLGELFSSSSFTRTNKFRELVHRSYLLQIIHMY